MPESLRNQHINSWLLLKNYKGLRTHINFIIPNNNNNVDFCTWRPSFLIQKNIINYKSINFVLIGAGEIVASFWKNQLGVSTILASILGKKGFLIFSNLFHEIRIDTFLNYQLPRSFLIPLSNYKSNFTFTTLIFHRKPCTNNCRARFSKMR